MPTSYSFGHTHKPYHRAMPYEQDGETRYRHAINIGFVGKPKDGDPRACYAIIELMRDSKLTNVESIQVEFVRVPYDVEKVARAVETSKRPGIIENIARSSFLLLKIPRWPN
jgi:diadenosine tetraphosphatase ApaH/serine/threonine PP2A family protein phosphatase